MNEKTILLTLIFIVVGGVMGKLYCELVRRSVAGIVSETAGMTYFLALMLVRVLLLAAVFVVAAYLGVWPMIGNLVGFFIVRTLVVVRVRRKNKDAVKDDAQTEKEQPKS